MLKWLLIVCFWCVPLFAGPTQDSDIALKMGVKIWYNEGGGQVSALTSWGRGESFASMGVGHFIWYPEGIKPQYGQSFYGLLRYLESEGVTLPDWLRGEGGHYCPWPDRESFMADLQSTRMVALRQLLMETVPLQAKYMVIRMEAALPSILAAAPKSKRKQVRKNFFSLAETPKGLFALVDYINFKGEGIGRRGRDWGLLHVLLQMDKAPLGLSPLESFVWAGDVLLSRRVLGQGKTAKRWLVGWRKRLYGYL